MRTKTLLAAFAFVAVAGGANAQSSIDPGMTREQVISKLGKPSSEHSAGTSTYLYYANGEERKVGMNDIVILDGGKVVDAVFRSPKRKYSGKSSSPAPVPADVAVARGNGGKMPEKHTAPMKVPDKHPAPAKVPEKHAAPTKAPASSKNMTAKKPDTAKKSVPAPAKKP